MPRNILIVEDHEPTARLIETVVEEHESSVAAHVVGDGNACLAVLRGEADSIPPPDLVLLDLGLPVIGGLSVLEERQEDSMIRDVPTIVLSGRDDRATIEECYEKRAEAFISKPDDFDGYQEVLTGAIEFWLSVESEHTNDGSDTPHDNEQGIVTGG